MNGLFAGLSPVRRWAEPSPQWPASADVVAYLVSPAVDELCPALNRQSRNSAAGYRAPAGSATATEAVIAVEHGR